MSNGVTIKLDSECLKHINLFQSVTKASVKDCIIDNDRILFVVNKGQAGLAIGKSGVNIKNLRRLLKKNIEVIEFSESLPEFLNNVFRPLKVTEVIDSESGNGLRKVIKVSIESENEINPKALARSKARKSRDLLKKYFNIDDINIQ